MKITRVQVSNYRNIGNAVIWLNTECSYIVGGNNIGKSNFLSLLSAVCEGRSFGEWDFLDPDRPIEVELEIKLQHGERGFYGSAPPAGDKLLKVRFRQKISDSFPTVSLAGRGGSFSMMQLRRVSFMKYETTGSLRSDAQKGAGMLINGMLEPDMLSDGHAAHLSENERLSKVLGLLSSYLGRIRSFGEHTAKTSAATGTVELLTGLFSLAAGERETGATGSSAQYMAMASINILCRIMELYKSRSLPFDELVYTDASGRRRLPIVLAIDEPEVHLHPYLQRSLIGFYRRILRGEDAEFTELLQLLFGVDSLDGQMIVVTHSTDALVGDYRNLIRFYRDGRRTAVVSGANPALKISAANEKHLIMRFPEIKEAFYANCAVLLEGETEYGCITAFAEKMGVALDDYGICIINARGEGSIKPLRKLLAAFAVRSVAVYDGDVRGGHLPADNEFYTREPCFEIEIVRKLHSCGHAALVRQIARELDSSAETVRLGADFMRKHSKKTGAVVRGFSAKRLIDVSEHDADEFCGMYSAWLMSKKGVLLGRIIGEMLPAELVPECYVEAIARAVAITRGQPS